MIEPPLQLTRHLGTWSIAALVIGETIAVGIFLTPATMARTLGSPLLILLVWLVMGGMALAGALCYGELAARYPGAGGGYLYLREAFGKRVAFLYGWKCLLVMDPGITAVLSMGFASYLAQLLPLSALGQKLAAIGTIVVLASVSVRGTGLAAMVMRWLVGLKLLVLGAIILLAFTIGQGDWSNFLPLAEQRPGAVPLPGALAPALVSAFFAFGGWWEISKLAGEARDPARTFPRGLTVGVLVVTAVYLLTSAAFIYLVPIDRVESGETFAAQAGQALFGSVGARVFSVAVLISVAGSLLALLMALPRAYFAMARDGVFLPSVGRLHPRFGTPALATAIQASLAILLVSIGTFDQVIAFFIFATIGFVGLAVVGLIRIRRRLPGAPFQTPGYPFTAAVFLVLVLVLLTLIGGHNPVQAGLGLLVVSLGVPVYHVLYARKTP